MSDSPSWHVHSSAVTQPLPHIGAAADHPETTLAFRGPALNYYKSAPDYREPVPDQHEAWPNPAAASEPAPTPAPNEAATNQAAAKQRSAWADIAKGVCILLVVMWHVIMKHYLQIDWHISVPLPGLWGTFGNQLLPLRMPVFFTISGMFAAAASRRPWSVVRRSRIAKFYYLYVIWFAVHTLVLSVVPKFDTLAARNPLDVLEQLTITPTNLWYLIALAWYFVVAKLTLKVPAPIVLGAAFVLSSIASAGLLASPGNRGQLYQNLLFFLAGLRLKPLVERLAGTATLGRLIAGAAGYFAVMVVIQLAGAKQWFGVWPIASALAVVLGVVAAAQLQRWRRPAALLTRLGQNTLPIYVMHMPILALLHLALLPVWSGLGSSPQLLLAAVLPVVMSALLVVICLGLRRGLEAAGAPWLFDLPTFRRTPQQRGGAHAQPPITEPAATQPAAAEPDWSDAPTRVLPLIR